MLPNQFNIRVYGLLEDEDKILVTDEYRLKTFMTKFPGGALEFGEGTIDCLKREFREELGMEIEIVSHFYTTDYFQQTELLPANMQLINIYYVVKAEKPYPFRVTEKKFDFAETREGAQTFRWVALQDIREEVTLPIDRKIAPVIQQFFEHR
jgi:8-oxo-dGTP diphosphatase